MPQTIVRALVIISTAKFVILNIKFFVFDTQFLVFNAKFLVFNAKLMTFTHFAWQADEGRAIALSFFTGNEPEMSQK